MRVFGFLIRRLTLRHCAALSAIDSPVVSGGTAGLSFAEAWQAAAVCAARGERELVAALWPRGRRWRQALRGWVAAVMWGRAWQLEAARLQWWLEAEIGATPKFLPGRARGRRPQGDWLIGMTARLMRMGMCEEAAWWTPLGLAGQYNVALAEADGREVPLLTEKLEDELKQMGWTEADLGG